VRGGLRTLEVVIKRQLLAGTGRIRRTRTAPWTTPLGHSITGKCYLRLFALLRLASCTCPVEVWCTLSAYALRRRTLGVVPYVPPPGHVTGEGRWRADHWSGNVWWRINLAYPFACADLGRGSVIQWLERLKLERVPYGRRFVILRWSTHTSSRTERSNLIRLFWIGRLIIDLTLSAVPKCIRAPGFLKNKPSVQCGGNPSLRRNCDLDPEFFCYWRAVQWNEENQIFNIRNWFLIQK
jgi:hypothetical protein